MESETEAKKSDEKPVKDDRKMTNNKIGVENRNHGRLTTVLMVMLFVFIVIGAAVIYSTVLCILIQLDLKRRLALDSTKTKEYKVKYAFYWWNEWSSWSPCTNTSCQFVFSRRERTCNVSSDAVRIPLVRTCVGRHEETRLCPLESYCLNCAEILKTQGRRNHQTSGIYAINPDGKGPFHVYCDMTTDGGGWTVFQRRQDGSVDFNRTWDEYKTGFGNLSGEFWLGNEYIHRLTMSKSNRTLRIDMAKINRYFAVYQNFKLSSEKENYTLTVDNYRGGYSSGLLESNQNGQQFSTVDRDHDLLNHVNCAGFLRGGWWYGSFCSMSLNGLYGYHFRWPRVPNLTYCEIKIK